MDFFDYAEVDAGDGMDQLLKQRGIRHRKGLGSRTPRFGSIETMRRAENAPFGLVFSAECTRFASFSGSWRGFPRACAKMQACPAFPFAPCWRMHFRFYCPTLGCRHDGGRYGCAGTRQFRRSGCRFAIGGGIYVSVIFALVGVLQAVSPMVAHRTGAGDAVAADAVLQHGLLMALLIAVPGVLSLCWPGWLLSLSSMDPAVEERARAYLLILTFGMPASLYYRTFYAYCNGIARRVNTDVDGDRRHGAARCSGLGVCAGGLAGQSQPERLGVPCRTSVWHGAN